ncbi:hypothetical protein MIMGU_mgv1a017043mg [Erythranthe guttata]|uniref:Uncharacterized protein n=1 Tax=Erythranthe guttata TaxID=4155 RepID=A0A022Q0J3_ERYGU|nr:hypothetical protein MIMGU_mgv1a017043mg [Erythranthe guttata]
MLGISLISLCAHEMLYIPFKFSQLAAVITRYLGRRDGGAAPECVGGERGGSELRLTRAFRDTAIGGCKRFGDEKGQNGNCSTAHKQYVTGCVCFSL